MTRQIFNSNNMGLVLKRTGLICTYERSAGPLYGGDWHPECGRDYRCQRLPKIDQCDAPGLLARVIFDESTRVQAPAGSIHSGLKLLEPRATLETLRVEGAVNYGLYEGIYRAETEELLLLALTLEQPAGAPLTATVQQGYQRLLRYTKERGYGHLVRIWNYLPRINEPEDGQERYRAFCVGRAAAFDAMNIAQQDYPSACALGTQAEDLVIYLLASRRAPMHFENPQQVSAWHYPQDYGPRSPAFARASLLASAGGGSSLFVSGTASVVGHATRYPGDVAGQLRVTLQNLDALLLHVHNTAAHSDGQRFEIEVLKIYLRSPTDLDTVRAGVLRHFGPVPTVFLAADICRGDLLLEIDGIWRLVS